MRLRIVRPLRRKESSNVYFNQRIPADVQPLAVGRRLTLPRGGEVVTKTIGPRTSFIKLSLGTSEPGEAKARHAAITAYLETVWKALRDGVQVTLTNRQAHALAGVLYRSWADETRIKSLAVIHDPETNTWSRCLDEREAEAEWAAVLEKWAKLDDTDLEKPLGPLVDRLLLAKGVGSVDAGSRGLLLSAFWLALRDAFELRERQSRGDYRPDSNSTRFPAWEEPGATPSAASGSLSLMALVEEWWVEAKARGLAQSTYLGYRQTMGLFVAFLGHDNAALVTPSDVVRFKDHRLTEVTAKTVKDCDLASFKSVFGQAVVNKRLSINPAEGITVKLTKKARLRRKSFWDEEARAILTKAQAYKRDGQLGAEHPKLVAAKQWVPWLCAYSGARVGEMVQLRKKDIRQEDGVWLMTITPEAYTVKTKEAREVALHPHLIELGFVDFVKAAEDGYLFLNPKDETKERVRGAWRTAKNRLTTFVREVVTDKNVQPNHGWRHLFKSKCREVGIADTVSDAITGHAAGTEGDRYGEVSVKAMAKALESFPRFTATQA